MRSCQLPICAVLVKSLALAIVSCLPLTAIAASGSSLLMQKVLSDLPDREALMLTVDYAPGGASPEHRHDAHTFVYVLEGTVQMQVAGQEVQTLVAGETFYETPEDIHVVSRNASDTEPARILVMFIKRTGAPATRPAE
jgi:quercetin dioxygenase-like cupin family protein